eukprot:COSAG06_NODE_895_length_11669_cov_5.131384_14_plen_63_part_00
MSSPQFYSGVRFVHSRVEIPREPFRLINGRGDALNTFLALRAQTCCRGVQPLQYHPVCRALA